MSRNISTCHPSKVAHGNGLCHSCYKKKWRLDNIDKALHHEREKYKRRSEHLRKYQLERYHRQKEVWQAASRRWKQKNKDRVSEYRRKIELRKKYGLTLDDYQKLLTSQNNLCAICSSPPERKRLKRVHSTLDVDHDHKTGLVRGLLCNRCNRLIALLESCGQEILSKAVKYLEANDARKIGSAA